jgi:NADPH-dependent 2,4-dienoyl-CoA reductase/sulfur reductase-like enzyme
VTLLIRSGQVLRTSLDDDVRPWVEKELAAHDVEVVQGIPSALEGTGQVTAVVADQETYPCDMVLLGVGAAPNAELAHQAGVALGSTGAIATDEGTRTNVPGIYAAGDCAEVLHRVTGEPVYLPLGSTANKQGRVAGTNAAGGRATFGGVVGTMIVRCFDLGVASTGLTTAQARALGYQVEETAISARDLSHYFPGTREMLVKLVADGQNGRLLGGQIVGAPAAAKRIDTLAAALHNRMTVPDLQGLDLAYAPPFAPVWDPILVAANVAAK